MLIAIAKVLIFQIFGETLVSAAELPVPGAVVGLALLLADFCVRRGIDEPTGLLFDRTIPYVPLLFVPAGAGVVAHLDLLAGNWGVVGGAVVGGTLLVLAVTGLTAAVAIALFERLPQAAS